MVSIVDEIMQQRDRLMFTHAWVKRPPYDAEQACMVAWCDSMDSTKYMSVESRAVVSAAILQQYPMLWLRHMAHWFQYYTQRHVGPDKCTYLGQQLSELPWNLNDRGIFTEAQVINILDTAAMIAKEQADGDS